MKKLLSLFLALSMIFSCVSMVVVNAEEAKEPVGVQITATEALTAMAYPRTKANFTAADVVWGDTNDDTSGNTLRQGSITRTFAVFNNSNGKYYGSIGFFGGNRLGIDGETSPNEGWEGVGYKDITLAAGGVTIVSVTFKVYEFAADGAVVVKVGTSKYGDVKGYAPLSTVYLRVNANTNTEANASVVIMPKAGESTVLFNLPNHGKATVTKVYEVPSRDFIDNGDAENGSDGWRSWGGGTTTVIEDPDNADNHIVKHVPTGIGNSVSYALEAYVLDAPELFCNGKGIGTYSISFRAKAEAGKGGKFNAMLVGDKNTGTYYTAGKSITMTDEWQTFNFDINVDETVYQTWIANGDSQIGFRLDGTAGAFGSWANPGTPFTYYVDDFTIKHESKFEDVEPSKSSIVDYLTYEISNNEIIITDCDESACGAYYVPALIEGYPVTCISASAFEDCNLITEIILPETIKEIDSFAFYGCSSLKEIYIPSEVTKINSYTFYNCSSLSNIYLPASITTINSNAFNGCENIEVIYFGGTEEQWSGVSINSGNATIQNATVNYQFDILLKYLSYDIIDNEVVITSCDSLYGGALVIPATIDGYPVTSIGDYAFRSCGGLISIVIPDSVVNIGVSSFESCSALTSITIPDSVTSIGDYAFFGCSDITSITIPDSVTSIGDGVFSYCSSLKEVHITNLTAWCNISFSNYSANPLYYAKKLYLNGELLIDLVIPEGVTSISDYAFCCCESLTSIAIPDSVTSIGYEAFYYCSSLTSIIIPNSVTSIGDLAFYSCSSLTNITIPESITSIGSYAFYNCSKLNAVYYRGTEAQWNSISIGSYNSYLTNATHYYNSCIGSAEHTYDDACDEQCNLCCFERTALHSYSSFGDLVCDICGVERPHPALQYITYELVENEVTITGCDMSVSGEFEIPATIDGYSVTSIGDYAFSGCRDLTSITIPDSVTNIGNYAFRSCGGLISIVIPDGVTSVGQYAFANCSNLTSVTIPESVTEIGYYAFYESANIKEVHITDIEAWCNITFGNIYYTNPLSYAKKLYLNGELLTDLVIPEGVTSISDYAFRYCESLTSVTIPDSVTSIGASAFECCSGLTSITIQDSITNISDSAFYLCDKLEKVNYFGAQSKWNNVTIGQNNTALTSAEISFITCTIEGATVDVGASLTINYFVKFNNIDKVGLTIDDFSMRFTSAIGKIYLVKGVFDAETGYYKYPYTGINPQCMNDNIKAELIYNDEVVAIKEYYSVKEYCERQSSRTASQLKLTLRQYNKLKTLLADMLVYGAASQEYKNYNISNLPDADDWVQNYKSNFTVPNGVRKITGNADANNKATSVGLNMANVNRIYFKVKITDDAIIKLNDVEIDKSTMIKNADGTYTLYSQDIKATQFNDVFTLTITKDGEEITKVEYNVNAYIQAKHTNTDLAKIVKALSNYGNTASEYAKLFSELDMEFELEEDIL